MSLQRLRPPMRHRQYPMTVMKLSRLAQARWSAGKLALLLPPRQQQVSRLQRVLVMPQQVRQQLVRRPLKYLQRKGSGTASRACSIARRLMQHRRRQCLQKPLVQTQQPLKPIPQML